jgi:hypothetical protein
MNPDDDDGAAGELVQWLHGRHLRTFCPRSAVDGVVFPRKSCTDMDPPNLRRLEKPDFVAVFEK